MQNNTCAANSCCIHHHNGIELYKQDLLLHIYNAQCSPFYNNSVLVHGYIPKLQEVCSNMVLICYRLWYIPNDVDHEIQSLFLDYWTTEKLLDTLPFSSVEEMQQMLVEGSPMTYSFW